MSFATEHFVIAGGLLVDGTGAEPRLADVEVSGGRIVAIHAPLSHACQTVVDAIGLHITPGFIDIHSHADYTILTDGRAHSATMQGITSVVTGNCGHGIAPLTKEAAELATMNIFGWDRDGLAPEWTSFSDYMSLLRDGGVGPNVFPLVAHGALRLTVAGFDDRPLGLSESVSLARLLEGAMAAGAAGLSTGLEYAPGLSSDTKEVCLIAEGMKDFGGLYATHCRNRSDAIEAAAAEAVAIARAGRARLQMSHFVQRPNGDDLKTQRSWDILRAARGEGMSVFADVFPFDYGPTPLGVLIPMKLRVGGRDEMAAKLRTAPFREAVLSQLGSMFEALVRNNLVGTMYVAEDGVDGSLNGLSLAQVADLWKLDPVNAAYRLLENAGPNFYCVTIVENWAKWSDLTAALASPDFYIMGDGATGSYDRPSPTMTLSDWGYVPRFLSDFVRDREVVSLAEAIHRMSLGPAQQIGLQDRGAIRVGNAADIVAFDLAEVGSAVAPSALREAPTGIRHVWVNGQPVVRDGKPTEARPGVVGISR